MSLTNLSIVQQSTLNNLASFVAQRTMLRMRKVLFLK